MFVKIMFEVEFWWWYILFELVYDVGGISVFIYFFVKVGIW